MARSNKNGDAGDEQQRPAEGQTVRLVGDEPQTEGPSLFGDDDATDDDMASGDLFGTNAADDAGDDLTPPALRLVDEPPPDDFNVAFMGRDFEIAKPDLAMICALLNAAGDIMIRAEKNIGQRLAGLFAEVVNGKVQSTMPLEVTVFGLLSVLAPIDVKRIAAIIFFGGKDWQKKEAEAFFRAFDSDDIPISPVIKAFSLRLEQSEDLADALGNLRLVQRAVTGWTVRKTKSRGATKSS